MSENKGGHLTEDDPALKVELARIGLELMERPSHRANDISTKLLSNPQFYSLFQKILDEHGPEKGLAIIGRSTIKALSIIFK